MTPDTSRLVTHAVQFGTNSPQNPKFAVWDFATGKRLAAWQSPDWTVAMAISNDAKRVVSLGHGKHKFNEPSKRLLVVWKAPDGRELLRIEPKPAGSYSGAVKIKFSKDDQSVYWLDCTVQRLDLRTGKLLAIGKKSIPGDATDLSVASGRFAWLSGGQLDVYATIDDFARGRRPKQAIRMPHQATEVRLSDDGKRRSSA